MPEHSASRMRDDMGAAHSSVSVLTGTRSMRLLSPWTPGDKALRGCGWARLTAQGEALDGRPTPWPQWGCWGGREGLTSHLTGKHGLP